MPNIDFKLFYALLMVIILMEFISFAIFIKKHKKYRPARIVLEVITIAICIGYGIYGACILKDAKDRGMYQTSLTWDQIKEYSEHAPIEYDLPNEIPTGSLIIYYKYGCTDCGAVYKDVDAAFKDFKNVFWVSTRSKQGKELRETYPVSKVPAGVFVTNTGTAITRNLYIKQDGKVESHEANIAAFQKLLVQHIDDN